MVQEESDGRILYTRNDAAGFQKVGEYFSKQSTVSGFQKHRSMQSVNKFVRWRQSHPPVMVVNHAFEEKISKWFHIKITWF